MVSGSDNSRLKEIQLYKSTYWQEGREEESKGETKKKNIKDLNLCVCVCVCLCVGVSEEVITLV